MFASDGNRNLKGGIKADFLVSRFGEKGFDYIGDNAVDGPVWKVARTALVASGKGTVQAAAQAANPDYRVIATPAPLFRDYLDALRLRQWVKNILVFLPMFLAHLFTFDAFRQSLLAFFSFCCCASAIYVVNDVCDLASDRQHPTKKKRPFASGAVPLSQGVACFCLMALGALVPGLFLPGLYLVSLMGYFLLTTGYTLYFKRRLLLDVVVLACLYVVRILAGATAIGGAVSNWLLGFGIFFFMGLALLKRTGDLIQHEALGGLPGRAYRFEDKIILESMAVCSGFSAIVVAALYIDSLQALQLYARPLFLWALCPLLIYWYGRLLILTHRGEMGDDPVYFAIRDRVSRCCFIVGLLLVGLAI